MRKMLLMGCLLASCLLIFSALPVLAQDVPAESNGEVIRMATTLNLRAAPSPTGAVISELTSGDPLIVLGRTANDGWLKVRITDGQEGWVASGYVKLNVALETLPILAPDGVAVTPSSVPETVTDEADESDADAPADAPSASGDAFVRAVSLNLRAAPTTRGAIITELPNRTALTLLARTADRAWLKVQTADGLTGWVSAAFIQTSADIPALTVDNAPVAVTVPAGGGSAPSTPSNVVSGIGATTLSIFRTGQRLGNRADVFSKVGDSITISTDVFDPLGRGMYNLGGYASLQSVIDFYLKTFARNQNSFANTSLAAGSGWTTATVLDPNFASPSDCQQGETPLECEYRLTKPAVALIMFGSNDVQFLDGGTYAANLQRIVQISKDAGVIPVISTIPTRVGYEGQVDQFNGIVREIARSNAIPLWDYHAAMSGLPNSGLSGDGLHPSASPSGYAGAADFNGENLQAGYVIRNLTALQVLNALYRQVLTR